MLKPLKKSTVVSNNCHEWKPETFSDFQEEIAHLLREIKEAFLFRGHRKSDWLVDSTLARSLKVQRGMRVTQRYSDEELAAVSLQHELARVWVGKFRAIELSPELRQFAAQGIDGYFEYHRHHQQNPGDPLIRDIAPPGTNFVDFTHNWKVALFFANKGREKEDEGALFIVRQKELGSKTLHRGGNSIRKIMSELEEWLTKKPDEMYGQLPLMVYPEKQLGNELDPKPARQEAVYLVQTDFRVDLELSWEMLREQTNNQVFVKLVLPVGSEREVQEYLTAEGVTEQFLMPGTIFDKKDFIA